MSDMSFRVPHTTKTRPHKINRTEKYTPVDINNVVKLTTAAPNETKSLAKSVIVKQLNFHIHHFLFLRNRKIDGTRAQPHSRIFRKYRSALKKTAFTPTSVRCIGDE